MPEPPKKFYLTTPIYYVNARPHIGHAYTTIVADVLARRSRAQGPPVGEDGLPATWFLTGTDEHGQKIERSAAAAGIPPQHFADTISANFESLWHRMGITNDQFIRTTDEAHKRGVQKLFRTLQQNGKIELRTYTGQYCVSEEMFVEGPPGTIGPDGRPTETVSEENYFFKLSEYQLPLLNLIESNTLQIEPESRRNEVLSFLRGSARLPDTRSGNLVQSEAQSILAEMQRIASELECNTSEAQRPDNGVLPVTAAGITYSLGALKDLSISRSSFTWGIPVPGDEKHVIYVWLDALANYLTAVGYGDDSPAAQAKFAKYWPADLHIVGKEIIRFHCVYWPAFLLAAGLSLPKKIVAHGWLLFDDSKMSKSKGNIVRTETILDAFGTLCPPPPTLPPDPDVISTEASQSHRDAQWRDPRISSLPLSPSTVASQTPVILSEAASQSHRDDAQSKNPEELHPATTLRPFPPQTPASCSPTPQDRDLFATDVLRYFLLREIPFGQDGSFSFEALITRYNADLANGYGNLVSRVLKMIQVGYGGVVPVGGRGLVEAVFVQDGDEMIAYGTVGIETLATGTVSITSGLQPIDRQYLMQIDFVRYSVDLYLSVNAPWKLNQDIPEDTARKAEVLYTAAESIRIITALLHPILPYATASVWRQLGLGDIEQAAARGDLKNLQWGGLQPGTRLGPLSPIFPRIEKKDIPRFIQQMTDLDSPTPLAAVTTQQDATPPPKSDFPEAPIASESVRSVSSVLGLSPDPTDPAAGPRTTTFAEPDPGLQVAGSTAATTERAATPPHNDAVFPTPANQPVDSSPQITIEDFAKIELRVAQIVLAERIPKADKLLRLEVDLGYERRQILSGIAEWYTPEDLLGRRIVVITNLAPRKMRGLESHGMLLAASTEGGKPHLVTIESADLPLGSRLK